MMRRSIIGAIAACLCWTGAYAQATDQVTYYHTDAIGSLRMVTDASGAVVQRHDYLPFGEEYPTQPPDRRLFAGKERDQETGFDYFGGRYYSGGNGRFTTVDPVLDIEQALIDPQRWSRYAYVRNNPFRYVDPDGRDTVPTAWQMTYGADGLARVLPAVGKALWNLVVAVNSPGHLSAEGEARRQGEFMQPASSEEAVVMGLTEWAAILSPLASAGSRASAIEMSVAAGGRLSIAEEIGILRGAASGRGNFGLGSATTGDAARLGEAWVGKGYTVGSDGKTLISADGLRQYRPPTYKPNLRRTQANFESRPVPHGAWGSNGHLDIYPE